MNSGNYNSLIKLASPQITPATYNQPSPLPARDAEFYKAFTSRPESNQSAKLNPRTRTMINAVGRGTAAGVVGGGTAGVTMYEFAKLNPRAKANTIRTEAPAGNTAPADPYIPGTYPAVNTDTGGNRANGVYRYY